ncbi:MAG: response regulator transcription factor [Lachnospiraceae bacterium]|nr:response regulator transcription factor [Lachnospiraceae bacterium]
MSKGKILIVEDSREISDMLRAFLQEHDYEVECAYEGKAASKLLKCKEYTIILMDLMLPFKSGEELIGELREQGHTPIICLSAKSQVETRLEVLRMGADDYILKPFDLNEVLVRIEVVLRRSVTQTEGKIAGVSVVSDCIEHAGLRLFLSENRVEYQGQNVALTLKEMQLLQMFLEHPTKTFTKANLYESVWGDVYYYEDNTINVHMSNLRKKLKQATGLDYIETVWGIGYRLNADIIK